MALSLSYIKHLSCEIWKYSVWYSWKYGHLSSGITTSWPANQSDAKLLEGGVQTTEAFDWKLIGFTWRGRIHWNFAHSISMVWLDFCAGNPLFIDRFPPQRSMWYFYVFFDVTLNKLLRQTVDLSVIWDAMALMQRLLGVNTLTKTTSKFRISNNILRDGYGVIQVQ